MSGVESLYPFLYAEGEAGGAAALEGLRRSTEDKVAQIVELRREVADRYAGSLAVAAAALADSFAAGGRLFAFGNGGSSSDAQALAQLFCAPPAGGNAPTPRALPAFALTNDVALVTALSNDVGFEVVFSRQIAAWARPGDIAVALSTSGGSANVLRGLGEAAARGMTTIGLAGYDGGRMAEIAANRDGTVEYLFVVPSDSVHRIQEAQTTVYQVLWELTHAELATRPPT